MESEGEFFLKNINFMNYTFAQTFPWKQSDIPMNTRHLVILPFFASLLATRMAIADPSAVGHYGGTTTGPVLPTLAAFDSSARGIISNLEIVGLQASCVTTLPGSGVQPAQVRSTNITRRETPRLRLRANSTFTGSFVLDDPGRLDFQNARVRVTGRLSGRRGVVTFVITQNESFTDGSSIACGGTARVPVRLARR